MSQIGLSIVLPMDLRSAAPDFEEEDEMARWERFQIMTNVSFAASEGKDTDTVPDLNTAPVAGMNFYIVGNSGEGAFATVQYKARVKGSSVLQQEGSPTPFGFQHIQNITQPLNQSLLIELWPYQTSTMRGSRKASFLEEFKLAITSDATAKTGVNVFVDVCFAY